MLSFYRFLAFAFILGGSGYFGYLGRPAEMGLAIVAGSIALAFSYIDKIQRFKGAGFEAEMRQQGLQVLARMIARQYLREIRAGNKLGQRLTVTSGDEKEAIKKYMQDHGWGHRACHEREQ